MTSPHGTRRAGNGRRPLAIVAVVVGVVLLLCVGITVLGAVVGPPKDEPAAGPAAGTQPATSPVVASAAASPHPASPAVSPADPAAANGVPPKPDAATQAAYIRDLKAIDERIVGDKDEDRIVGRGRDQCRSIATYPNDRAKIVDLANRRFTAPTHPDGFGLAVAERIVVVVHKHLCPQYPLPPR